MIRGSVIFRGLARFPVADAFATLCKLLRLMIGFPAEEMSVEIWPA
jgi:hypothetical protein